MLDCYGPLCHCTTFERRSDFELVAANGNMGKQTLGPIRKFQQGLPDLIGSGTGSECTQL